MFQRLDRDQLVMGLSISHLGVFFSFPIPEFFHHWIQILRWFSFHCSSSSLNLLPPPPPPRAWEGLAGDPLAPAAPPLAPPVATTPTMARASRARSSSACPPAVVAPAPA